jgi:hypothetical protein
MNKSLLPVHLTQAFAHCTQPPGVIFGRPIIVRGGPLREKHVIQRFGFPSLLALDQKTYTLGFGNIPDYVMRLVRPVLHSLDEPSVLAEVLGISESEYQETDSRS